MYGRANYLFVLPNSNLVHNFRDLQNLDCYLLSMFLEILLISDPMIVGI